MSELDFADTITDPPASSTPEAEAGADAGQPSAAADTDPSEGAAGAEPVAAPAWTPDDPAFRDAVAQEAAAVADARLAQFLDSLTQSAGDTDGLDADPGELNLDPLDPGFPQQLAQFFQARDKYLLDQISAQVGQMLKPIINRESVERDREGEERMRDVLADIASRKGEFPADKASRISSLFFQEARQRYGDTPRAAEAALEQAADFVLEIRKEAEQIGYQRAEQELAGLSGARREPAGAGDGRVVPLDGRGNELDFADEFVAKRGLNN